MHPGVSYSSSGLQSSSTWAAPMTAIVSDDTIDLKNSERMWKGCMWMFVDACCGSPSKHISLRKIQYILPFLSTEDAVVVTLSPTLSAFSYKSIWIVDVVRRRLPTENDTTCHFKHIDFARFRSPSLAGCMPSELCGIIDYGS